MPRQKRLAVIDRELCKPDSCGYACQKACPINRSGDECVTIAELDRKPNIDEGLCVGCGICVKKCQKGAIDVINLPAELDETPIHRYGKNKFALYRLPIPKKMVVGLVGPNGVGKSTVLNILSGNLKPNTGIFGRDTAWDEIIARFSGTELQDYLRLVSVKKIKAGFKPQHVDLIPEMFKGKVRELLAKSGPLHEKAVSALGIGGLLDKDVHTLSGGELQLAAVAATMSRECDFYFFDEPSSYLDVKERLLVAKEISKLGEKAMVMVVEHDLAIADYMAENVHILYGKPAVFGIVSKPYGVRVGINSYLEGYIREENIRFREESINLGRAAKAADKNKVFMKFPAFAKKFTGFSLRTHAGSICRGEVIGILGPNGTGKSTFIKMLAGEVEPDEGDKLEGVRLSCKSQRLIISEAEKRYTVKDYIEQETGRISSATDLKRFTRALGVERLFERLMGSLSGGELQAVLIATAMGKEHDILLLDEPSAFLDVEQRLRMCRMIRAWAEERETPVFVVDHDLQVIDSVSDRIMVFSGASGLRGEGSAPCDITDGMNDFLSALGVTFRKEKETGRHRANKPGSQKDVEQKQCNEYYA